MEHAREESAGVVAVLAEELLGDIQRYLEAVRVFRELGCEPSWNAETHAPELAVRPAALARAI